MKSIDLDSSCYPVWLQEQILGTEVGVEARFVAGTLVGRTYSHILRTAGQFRPSTARKYLNPPFLEFEGDLKRLGKSALLTGFAKVTFIEGHRNGLHYLIDADLRPNVWHQYGSVLGVDWSANITDASTKTLIRQKDLPVNGFLIFAYPRELLDALRFRKSTGCF